MANAVKNCPAPITGIRDNIAPDKTKATEIPTIVNKVAPIIANILPVSGFEPEKPL